MSPPIKNNKYKNTKNQQRLNAVLSRFSNLPRSGAAKEKYIFYVRILTHSFHYQIAQ